MLLAKKKREQHRFTVTALPPVSPKKLSRPSCRENLFGSTEESSFENSLHR
jgi:hypothetical protein